ncbi:hypothetical protein OROMI_023575 [Orobanche minor]
MPEGCWMRMKKKRRRRDHMIFVQLLPKGKGTNRSDRHPTPYQLPREVASQGGEEDPPRDLDSQDKVHLPPVPQHFLRRAPSKRDDDDISSEEDEHASGSGLMDIKLPQKPLAPKSIPLTNMMESDVIPSKKEEHVSDTKSDEPGSFECLWCEERFDSYKLARKHILLSHGQWEEGFQPHGPDDPIYEDDTFYATQGPSNVQDGPVPDDLNFEASLYVFEVVLSGDRGLIQLKRLM